MKFHKMRCNGNNEPLGVGSEILLSWSYSYDGKRGEAQRAFSLTVESENGEGFDSGVVDGGGMSFILTDFFKVKPCTYYRWRIRAYTDSGDIVSPDATFETAADDLDKAEWISCPNRSVSSPVFSRTFNLDSRPVKARAYVTGLGLAECSLNGRLCSDRKLAPPNTLYGKICYFNTFDITELLNVGENIFSVQLGHGYDLEYSQYGYQYDNPMGMRCLIKLTMADGSVREIVSGGDWLGRDSEITSNGLYAGEIFDASKESFEPFDLSVDKKFAPTGRLIADEMPPIRVVDTFYPIQSRKTDDGMIYDFGRNIQGVVEIEAEGGVGHKITLRHSEMINSDGNLDCETNRGAKSEDVYICGKTRGVYEPKFTYHGFRYVHAIGTDGLSYFSIRARHISSDVEEIGEFSCSDATINRIHKLCRSSMRSNFTSIPTDCPVRDERTPCQMDSQMMEDAALCNYNMFSYYTKWLRDITGTPYRDGEGNPDWHGDYIMLAYRFYLCCGDLRPFALYYPRMKEDIKRWLDGSEDGVWVSGFGDWCLPNNNTWETIGACKTTVNTSLFFAYCKILAEMSPLLGHAEGKEFFESAAQKIRDGFYKRCLRSDGSVESGRQTDMVMPLFFGLIDGEQADKTRAALLRRIKSDAHPDTGGFGTGALVKAMADAGGIDEIIPILSTPSYPSFGNLLANGATTLWEQWAVKGVMHSHSHEMFAGIDAAFFKVFCGLNPIEPGYKRFEISPRMPSDMSFCECAIDSVSGKISVRAERLYGGLELTVEIPPNTTALVRFPDYDKYNECGLWDGERRIEKRPVIELGGGIYNLRLVPESCFERK